MSNTSKEQHVATIALNKAEECLARNNDGLAFANFLLFFKLAPSSHDTVKSQFLDCMGRWRETLHRAGRSEDLLKCLHEACSVLPDNPQVLNSMGTELFNLGFLDEAASYFRKSVRADNMFLVAKTNLQNLCSHVMERWHFRMLNDTVRNRGYRDAIHRAVSSGQHNVLDVGAGTGILSMFAVNAGASSVYACEMSKVMFDISTDCIASNRLSDKINLLHMPSTALSVPQHINDRVTLLITETFDAGLLGEHILSTLHHAWQDLLANTQQCVVIPKAATVYICAIESEWLRKQHRVIYPGTRYLEYGSCSFVSPIGSDSDNNEPYTSHRLCDIPGGYKVLSDVLQVQKFLFDDATAVGAYHDGFRHMHTMTFTSQGHLDAFALWFDLHLDDRITLSSNPNAGSCWDQAIYPIFHSQFEGICDSLNVGLNDKLTLCIKCRDNALQVKSTDLIRSSNHKTEDIADCGDEHHEITSQFILSEEEISAINDLTWNQIHCQALEEIRDTLDTSTFRVLLILSNVSMLPLQAIKLGASQVCVVSDNNMMCNVLTHVAGINDLSLDEVVFVDSVDMVEGKWDILLTDVIECCGSLRPHILEDIALARMTCMSANSRVIPDCISIYGVLVESDSLLQDSCVISDEKTLGLKIHNFINDFQVNHHVDVHLSTLEHQKLSTPFDLFTFNLNEHLDENSDLEMTFLHQNRTMTITTSETGSLAAVLYWFDLKLTESLRYSTLHNSSHIYQGAFMQREKLSVNAGVDLEIETLCKNSCLNVTLCVPT